MEEAKLSELRKFIDECRSEPSVLHDPWLKFFKDYLLSLGARIPPKTDLRSTMTDDSDDGIVDNDSIYNHQEHGKWMETDDIDEEIIESDIEFQGEVVEADNDPPQQMGDPTVEITEHRSDAAQSSKANAMTALSKGQLEEALRHLTEAIMLNPRSAIFYATRAIVLLKMNKPNAAVRDAEAALQLNPDSAKGYKSRGMARALLGKWEEAAQDLRLAAKLDYDEEINLLLKEKVEPNVHKIKEHRRKYVRLRKDREIKKTASERRRKGAEAQAANKTKNNEQSSDTKATDSKIRDPEPLTSLRDGTVITLHSSKELETKLKAASTLYRLVILYFTATWCGPCRFMAPLYTKLAEKYPKVVFLKIDIDQLSAVAQSWNISSIPTFFFVKQGKEIDTVVGAESRLLERKIDLHMSKS